MQTKTMAHVMREINMQLFTSVTMERVKIQPHHNEHNFRQFTADMPYVMLSRETRHQVVLHNQILLIHKWQTFQILPFTLRDALLPPPHHSPYPFPTKHMHIHKQANLFSSVRLTQLEKFFKQRQTIPVYSHINPRNISTQPQN